MIDKALLKQSQPVAWKTLSQTLKSGRLSHAYLFYGPKNNAKNQMAVLFAQSLSCEHPDEEGFACQECESCRRIEKEESADVYYLHPGGVRRSKPLTRKEIEQWWKTEQMAGAKGPWRIRKEDILQIQDAFKTTAASEGERRVYIIDQYEQATPSASNSLLKFLEEPQSALTGVLLTDQLANILPTIVSRCQLIPFRARSVQSLQNELDEVIDDPKLTATLARAGYDLQKAQDLLEDEAIFEIREAAERFWKQKADHAALVDLELGVLSKNAHLSRSAVEFFCHCLIYEIDQENTFDLLHLDLKQILLEMIDSLRLPLDPALALERLTRSLQKRMQQEKRS